MIAKDSQEISSGNYIAVPPTANVPTSQLSQSQTPYDYLALLPALIAAATPLILGLRKKDKSKNEDKRDEDKKDEN